MLYQLCTSFATSLDLRRVGCTVNEVGRPKREWLDGETYHLFSRGSNREAIFVEWTDYADFMRLLSKSAARHDVGLFAWALMPNHWHLLARCPARGLSTFVQHLNHPYALLFNRRNGRTAHLLTVRFGAVLQQTDEQFLWTLRYVLRNPVTVDISVEEVPWTSYRATVGNAAPPSFLLINEVLAQFGPSHDQRVRGFNEFLGVA